MIAVTDTMGLVLYLEGRNSGPLATQIFSEACTGISTIYIPTMICAEIGYLSERKRIGCSLADVMQALASPNFIEYPMSFNVICRAFKIDDIPELHDRLIAGTSAYLDLPLISNDPVITASVHCNVIW